MGYVYEDGKEYPRAGVYRRSSNGNVNNTVASALDGIGVLPIKSDWGPLNEVTIHEIGTSDVTMKNTYGTGGTMSVAEAYMDGGLDKLYLVRLGTGGKSGKIELKSNETKAVTLTLKYPGTHEFTVSVRDKLGAESTFMTVQKRLKQSHLPLVQASLKLWKKPLKIVITFLQRLKTVLQTLLQTFHSNRLRVAKIPLSQQPIIVRHLKHLSRITTTQSHWIQSMRMYKHY